MGLPSAEALGLLKQQMKVRVLSGGQNTDIIFRVGSYPKICPSVFFLQYLRLKSGKNGLLGAICIFEAGPVHGLPVLPEFEAMTTVCSLLTDKSLRVIPVETPQFQTAHQFARLTSKRVQTIGSGC